ncbi:hypothetical protein ABMA28_011621 [Loxostege sticticalis]|uniref:Uncharacterized protein n=1 Tax=Loxostege sticticalis TaxID=481309 RepID=A0ABD0S5U9_LOXSC
MEKAFEEMKQRGKNDVDSLLQWMKDSKVIENTKEAEKKARLLFEDAVNKNNVELEKFKQALEKIATQQKKSVEDLAKTLAAESERMLHKLSAGVSAGVEAFTKEFKK